MRDDKCSPAGVARLLFIFAMSVTLLYSGFFNNSWQVADQKWFANHQRDMESHIVGRMVKSRQDGIFSDGGLAGYGSADTMPPKYSDRTFSFQYSAYINGLVFGAYTTYDSQIGGQGMLFSMLDKMLSRSPREKLRLFHALTALLSALILVAVIIWFYLEFGLTVALFVLASAAFSQWLVVFGRNLYWSMWAFYLPMTVVMYHLKHNSEAGIFQPVMLGILVFVTVFVKCLFNGYEYITSTLVMMMVPVVYYSVRDKLSSREFSRGLLAAVFGSCLAVLLSFSILSFQIAAVKGGIQDGIDHIVYSLKKRTHADADDFHPALARGLEAGTATVVARYLEGTYLDLENYLSAEDSLVPEGLFKLRYSYLTFLFFIMSCVLYFRRNKYMSERQRQGSLALISATWFSILAPLSWFVVFKAHSYQHTHMNYIVWQMPFVFFGFAVCGLAIRSLLPGRKQLT